MITREKSTALSGKVLKYQKTGDGYNDILKEISIIIYRYPQRKYGWGEDDCSEFYLFFYRRIMRIIRNYNDVGRNFEAYLYSSLKWQFRIYSRKRLLCDRDWKYSSLKEFWNTADEPAGAEPEGMLLEDYPGIIRGKADSRHYILYILKQAVTVCEEDIVKAAAVTGYSYDWLGKKVCEIRSLLFKKEKRLTVLRERRNRAYYKLILLEEELHDSSVSDSIDYCMERIVRLKKTMKDAQTAISKIKLSPSNRELADIIKIPKGTIDSSLYSLKKKAVKYNRIWNKRLA